MSKPKIRSDGRTITVRVPISIKKRGGRKLLLAPDGKAFPTQLGRHIDNALVKAIARAFRWREMLESGQYSTIREIAAAERINETYVGRVLRLTLLAPLLVETILRGEERQGLQVEKLMSRFPPVWEDQVRVLLVKSL